jgi:hypothetical protein
MRDDGLYAHGDHILSFFRAYEAMTASTMIKTAWRKAGFEYENKNTAAHLSANQRQIREPLDFRDISLFDYQEIRLSTKRQKQEWG